MSSKITDERIGREKQMRWNPFATLTPSSLTTALNQFKAGYLGDAARIWTALQERDDKIAALRAKRLAALSRNGWEVVTTDDSPEAIAQKEALEYTFNHLTACNALDADQCGGASLLLRQMGDALGMKYAVHELCWKPEQTATGWQMGVECRFAPLWFFENTTGRMRFISTAGGATGEAMEAGAWMVSVADAALMEPSSVLYIYKRMPLSDWLAYSERFGSPAIIGRTAAAQGSDAGNAMRSAVKTVGSEMEAVIYGDDGSSKIELISPDGGSGQLPFPDLVRRAEEALSVLWQGGDLSTMSSAAGQGTGASLQGDSLRNLEADDAQWASEILQNAIGRRVIAWKFGPFAEAKAYIRVKTSAAAKDAALDLQVIKALVEMGAPVAVQDALETFGKTTPDDGEELLKAPQPQQPVGGFGNQMANEKRNASFLSASIAAAAKGVAKDFAPLRGILAELQAAAASGDGERLKAAAAKAKDELAKRGPEILSAPSELQKQLETILAPALLGAMAGEK